MTSQNAERLASFHQQMADVTRGDRLRRLREQRHISQEEAAHNIGVTTKTYGLWERGARIRWKNAVQAGAFYGVDPDELVTREVTTGAPFATESAEVLRAVEELRREVAAMKMELLTAVAALRIEREGPRRKREPSGRTPATHSQ